MFSIEVSKDDDCVDVTLVYTSATINFRFNPENPDGIPSLISGHGEFSGTTSNGVCSFIWTPTSISFEVAKYGDGEGGSLSIVVANSPETMESLKEALNQWKAAIEH